MEEKDHTVLFVVSAIVGVLITITLLIFVSAYNNNHNIERDKFIASHCKQISKEVNKGAVAMTKYRCN